MIKEFIDQWERNKYNLEIYFKSNKMAHYDSYEKLVKLILKEVMLDDEYFYDNEINSGGYSGTNIYFFHKTDYPDIEDYYSTYCFYGSCSVCDTLDSIINYNWSELPNDEQVKDLMLLCLHLVQRMKNLIGGDEIVYDD